MLRASKSLKGFWRRVFFTSIYMAFAMVRRARKLFTQNFVYAYKLSKVIVEYARQYFKYSQNTPLSKTAIVTYQGRLEYELEVLETKFAHGELSEDAYQNAVKGKRQEISESVFSSFLSIMASNNLSVGFAFFYTRDKPPIYFTISTILFQGYPPLGFPRS